MITVPVAAPHPSEEYAPGFAAPVTRHSISFAIEGVMVFFLVARPPDDSACGRGARSFASERSPQTHPTGATSESHQGCLRAPESARGHPAHPISAHCKAVYTGGATPARRPTVSRGAPLPVPQGYRRLVADLPAIIRL